jgi:hypothetical protein
MPPSESGRRRCRTCGEPYEYPVPGSLATRAYCGSCTEIPPELRRVLELLRRRLDRLARAVAELAAAKGREA